MGRGVRTNVETERERQEKANRDGFLSGSSKNLPGPGTMNALLHGTKGFELFPEDLDLFRPDSRREAYAPFAALPVHGLCAELSQNRFRIRRSRPRIAGTQGDLQIGPVCLPPMTSWALRQAGLPAFPSPCHGTGRGVHGLLSLVAGLCLRDPVSLCPSLPHPRLSRRHRLSEPQRLASRPSTARSAFGIGRCRLFPAVSALCNAGSFAISGGGANVFFSQVAGIHPLRGPAAGAGSCGIRACGASCTAVEGGAMCLTRAPPSCRHSMRQRR